MNTKQCSICNKEKHVSEFYKKRNGLTHRCKLCEKTYQEQYYIKHRQKRITTASVHSEKRIRQIRDYVIEYLKQNPCIDCGERNILTLQFDHQTNKHFNISEKISSKRPIGMARLKQEISKCIIRCANCHQIKTAHSFNWWKLEYL